MPGKSHLNGLALASVSTGALLTWSGLKGWSILATAGEIVSGKPPAGSNLYPLTVPPSGGPSLGVIGPGGASDSTILNTGEQYKGHAYLFGGAPGRDGSQPWDCSSMWNWIVGVKLKGAIPGNPPGSYTGTSHGPPTGLWATWPGLQRISASQVQPGDFYIWAGHMGVAVDQTTLLSALDTQDGTTTSLIKDSGNGPLLKIGRYIG